MPLYVIVSTLIGAAILLWVITKRKSKWWLVPVIMCISVVSYWYEGYRKTDPAYACAKDFTGLATEVCDAAKR